MQTDKQLLYCEAFEHNGINTAKLTMLEGVFLYDTPFDMLLQAECLALIYAIKYAIENNKDVIAYISPELYKHYCGYVINPYDEVLEQALKKIYNAERFHLDKRVWQNALNETCVFTLKRFHVSITPTELMQTIWTQNYKDIVFKQFDNEKDLIKNY